MFLHILQITKIQPVSRVFRKLACNDDFISSKDGDAFNPPYPVYSGCIMRHWHRPVGRYQDMLHVRQEPNTHTPNQPAMDGLHRHPSR
jgi:hypothetical protein